MKKRKKKAFTLIELIVVIAILAILVGIAIPTYSGYRKKAEKNAILANEKMLKNAATMYFIDTNENKINWPEDDTHGNYVQEWPEGFKVTGNSNNINILFNGEEIKKEE